MQLHASGQRRDHFFVLPGLGDKVCRPALHRFDDGVDVAVRRDHDDHHLRVDVEDSLEPLEPLAAG